MTLRLDRVTIVWIVLIAATLLTATLGLEQHGASHVLGALLLVIAYVKVRLVVVHFMEIRDAPPALRVLMEAYVAVTGTVLVVLQLVR